ncbi:MAG: DNA repair protein RadA [bacterium]|nr:DNA repair protein RadA [bacterium]
MGKHYCKVCGYESLRWLGKCPTCGEWNSLIEEVELPSFGFPSLPSSHPVPLQEISSSEKDRVLTKIGEFDRVLGGGVVLGSIILIGGDPGIGKSTLLLQVGDALSKSLGKVLYVSGEESAPQVKLRADRLGIESPCFYILPETNMQYIISTIEEIEPHALIIDSIQTIYMPKILSSPGSVSQVRECTAKLVSLAKGKGIPIFIIGHVTKEGAIAGPKILEHMVDTVLYLEGEKYTSFRLLRAVKNRFGETREIGIFEMRDFGLEEVLNPSSFFLRECPTNVSGSVVTASLQGTRPVLVEIQVLVTETRFGIPKRETVGVDYNRVNLLIAVLEKRVGLHLSSCDLFVNVAGGVRVLEPDIDLAITVAISSNFKDKIVDGDLAILGEVGLLGEVRSVSYIDKRIREIEKLGFRGCVIPKNNLEGLNSNKSFKKIGVSTVKEALESLSIL